MSIDRYFAKIRGKWTRADNERDKYRTSHWVDICHGGPYLIDERYFFSGAQEAAEFYDSGYRLRMFEDEAEIDHKGLYVDGVLAAGASIHGDPPGHEGEKLRRIARVVESALNEGAL